MRGSTGRCRPVRRSIAPSDVIVTDSDTGCWEEAGEVAKNFVSCGTVGDGEGTLVVHV